jgi:regulator of RNase E activity RraA
MTDGLLSANKLAELTQEPGDLLHGDANGLIRVPDEIAAEVAAEGRLILDKEEEKVQFNQSDGFSLEKLAELFGW